MDQLCRVPVGRLSRVWRDVVNLITIAFWFWFAAAAIATPTFTVWWLNGKSPDRGDIAQTTSLAVILTLVVAVAPIVLRALLSKRQFDQKHWELKVDPASDQQVRFILKQRHPHQVYAVRCVIFDPTGWRGEAEYVMSLEESCTDPAWFTFPDAFSKRPPARSGVYRTIWYARRTPAARWVPIYRDKRTVDVTTVSAQS